jgi:hypothetical protein
MEPSTTPTPGSAHFPEDPLMILRFGWPFLVAYYVVATIIVILLWRNLKPARFTRSPKQRAITAAVLAAIFAPGEVSDFFLFNLPGPAIIGLALFLVAFVLIITSQPAALLKASFWGGFFSVVGGYYLLPLLVVFAIAYAALSFYVQVSTRYQTPNQALERTADREENYKGEIRK